MLALLNNFASGKINAEHYLTGRYRFLHRAHNALCAR